MMGFLKTPLLWLLVLCSMVGCSRPPKVEVVQPQLKELAEVLAVSGRIHGRQESQLAPEVGGTVREIVAREGEEVKQGELLARLDTSVLEAQYRQAEERVAVAQAQLEVAQRPPLPSEFAQARAEVERERRAAGAALTSARQRLLQAQRGARTEQQDQASAALAQARAEAEQKNRERQRLLELYQRGAVSKQDYERGLTAYRSAAAALESARARLTETTSAVRPEELEQARQAVVSAEADQRAAEEAGEARLQQLRDRPRPEDVQLAQAQLAEAREAAVAAKSQLERARLVAPYDGVVGRRLLRVGDSAGPSAPVFTFSSRPALEVRVDVDESERNRLTDGLTASVKADGYPERFSARLYELSPEVDPVRGTLEARFLPDPSPDWLIPGQTVDVNLLLSPSAERLVIPLTCVRLLGDTARVAVIESGKVELRVVEVSHPSLEGYLVKSGLESGDWVALYPQELESGQKVRVQKP